MLLRPEALAAALATLAPGGVRVGVRAIQAADAAHLHQVEALHIASAVAKRRREYATGRRLLREILSVDTAIPTGADRLPQLPDGFVGSLAHDAEIAIAAVAQSSDYIALGIDVEPDLELDEAMSASILRVDESLDAHLAFTLKEAVYKAWSTSGGAMLEHHDVRLSVAVGEPRSEPVSFRGDVLGWGDVLHGRYTWADGRWLALVTVPLCGSGRE